MGPLFPFIHEPKIPLTFLNAENPPMFGPFGSIILVGCVAGVMLIMHRARQRDFDMNHMTELIVYALGFGFVLSHMIDAVLYHPDKVMENPLFLLHINDGLSSYGGFIGATVGGWIWAKKRGVQLLEYADVCANGFTVAWVFGRFACSVVHDHPGKMSNAWYAVSCVGEPPSSFCPTEIFAAGFQGRVDLGLIEMLLTIPLAAACWILWERKIERPAGYYIGLILVAYAPVRFALDALRADVGDYVAGGDPRYLGLTPGQWISFAALAVGLYFARLSWGKPYVRLVPYPPDDVDERGRPIVDDDDEEEEEAPRPKRRRKKRKRRRRRKAEATD